MELFLTGLKDIGAPALGLTLLLAAAGLPIPSAVLLLAAGGLGGQGVIDWRAALFFGWVGVVAGDCGGYGLGRLGGAWLMPRFQRKRPSLWLNARDRFQRHGSMAIFLTRTVFTVLDFPMSFLAGSLLFPFGQFLAYDMLGRYLWITVHLALGYAVGERWPAIARFVQHNSLWIGGLIIITLSLYLLRQRICNMRQPRLTETLQQTRGE